MMRTMAGFLPGFLLCGSIIIWGSRPVQAAAYQYTTISNSSHPNDGVYAEGLNDGGVVVGMDTTQKIGFVWANGIGKAINGAVYFNAINDNNVAAGALYGTDNAGIVVTYNVASGSIQNYQLPIPVDVVSRVFINAGGEIAGTSYAKDFKKNVHGFVYNRAKKKAYQLDAPNSGITEYTAVNAYGDLIGEVVGTQFIATCPSGETCVK